MAKKQTSKTTTKVTKAQKASKATKTTKAGKPSEATPQDTDSQFNLPLANFLIRLAVDDEFRDRFSQSRMTVNRLSVDLSDEDRAALIERNDVKILQQLAVNNQST